MNERSPLLNPTPLPDSSVSTTVDSGKLVGAEPGDLPKGTTSADYVAPREDLEMPTGDASIAFPEPGFGGFLGRSHGWDR